MGFFRTTKKAESEKPPMHQARTRKPEVAPVIEVKPFSITETNTQASSKPTNIFNSVKIEGVEKAKNKI